MTIRSNFTLHGRRNAKSALRLCCLLSVFHAILLAPQLTQANAKRYQPKSNNQKSVDFYGRYGADLVNWQYIRADIIGQVRQAVREGRDVLGELDDYVVTNANGSVFILPGVDADELTIINDGSGNPIIIKR